MGPCSTIGPWSTIGSLFYNLVLGLQFGSWLTSQFGPWFTIWSMLCNWSLFCSQVLVLQLGPCFYNRSLFCSMIGFSFYNWVFVLQLGPRTRITISYSNALVFIFYLCQCKLVSPCSSDLISCRPVYLVSKHFAEIGMNSSVNVYSDIVASLLEPRILVNILLWHNLRWFLTRSC